LRRLSSCWVNRMVCNFLVWSFDAVSGVNWLEVFKTVAAIATAIIAFLALKNWQRQDKAKREDAFLDELVEATHAYIVEIQKPITMLDMAKIGMASHVESWGEGSDQDKSFAGAIAYIQKRGEKDGTRLQATLDDVEPTVVRLRSLTTKGQVFSFDGYKQGHDAATILAWHFDRMLAFTSMIRSPTWNWENPEVRSLLVKLMAIDADDIRKSVGENNIAVLEFAQKTYGRLYG
jgi:hypothetical protein